MRDLYKTITEQIIAELKAGVRPWLQPWSQTPGLNFPCNAVTGRPYSGINTLLLWRTRDHGWAQPRFLTFKQALEADGHVRKGEHGQHVVFVTDRVKRETEEDEPTHYRVLKTYTVFNVEQCDDLPETLITPRKTPNPDQRDALIDEFITTVNAEVKECRNEDRAGYNPELDCILLPVFGLFRNRAHYAAVLFHELVHWTGHQSRLDRQLGKQFGARTYAAEELIAELGAAFLCAEFSIDGTVPHATYIESYLEFLENNPRAIFIAASKAQSRRRLSTATDPDGESSMTPETEKQSGNPHPYIICGEPISKGNYCRQCIDRGFGPCEACEGLSFLDVETTD